MIFSTIDSVPELQWNKHLPEVNRLMFYEELKLIEAIQKDTMQFRYVLVQKDEATVGLVYFQVVKFTGNDLLNYFPEAPDSGFKKYIYSLAKSLSEPIVRGVNLKLLVTGNIFMTGENGFYFNHGTDKSVRASLLRKAIDEVAGNDPSIRAILISDLYAPKSDFDCAFSRYGYHEITVESDMSIKLDEKWKTFDDYLNALASKYRIRAKKAFALSSENGVVKKEMSIEEVIQYEDRLYELYQKVMSRAEFKLAVLNRSFFRVQKQNLPSNYGIFAYFKQNELIGFISFYHIGKRMEVHYTGMEQEICKPLHLYQRMMYDMVAFGIEHRMERLHFGRTAPEIKSTIGAVPSPMYGYVKHFNKLFNAVFVRTFTSNLKPQKYIMRNPFKGSE